MCLSDGVLLVTMKYYSAVKKRESLLFSIGINLENAVLRPVSGVQKNTICVTSVRASKG